MDDFQNSARSKLDAAREIIVKVNKLSETFTEADETALLNNFRDNMFSYSKLVNKAFDDDVVTIEEMEEIQIIEKKILQESRAIMLEDGEISKGEGELISKLIELFENLNQE
jgi:hypothetical protein